MSTHCLQCEQFDRETRDKMRELFHRDEMLIAASSLVSFLLTMQMQIKKAGRDNIRRFQFEAQVQVTSRMLGKFKVGLEPKDWENFMNITEKQSGVKLSVASEPCPHGNEEKNDVQQTGQTTKANGSGSEGSSSPAN